MPNTESHLHYPGQSGEAPRENLMTDKVIVYTTCGNAGDAETIAQALIDRRLAACVNVFPGILSYYRWKGKIENATEFLLLIKTSRDLVDKVRAEIERLHTYDLPEMIVSPIVDGCPNYLAWMDKVLSGTGD